MRVIRRIGHWLDERLQLGTPIRDTMDHPIPHETASWFYVFGSAANQAARHRPFVDAQLEHEHHVQSDEQHQ